MSADILTPAILRYVDNGAYPDSEDVASAELQPNALSNILQELRKEQDSVKEEIRGLSKGTAPDIDTWISRAKELQADILRSRETARQIVAEAEAGRDLRAKVQDSGNRVALLEKEVLFNETLTGTLEHINYASGVLNKTKDEAVAGRVEKALESLETAEASIAGLQGVENSRAYELLQSRSEKLRESLAETTTECWNSLLAVDQEGKKLTIRGKLVDKPDITLSDVASASERLQLHYRLFHKLSRDIDRSILKALMSEDKSGKPGQILISGAELVCERAANNDHSLFVDIKSVLDFLVHRLPSKVGRDLSESLMPMLVTRLEESWLESSVPLEMSQMSAFESTLNAVLDLAGHIDGLQWQGAAQLREWVESAPRTWLTKRRDTVLGDVRNLVFSGLHSTKTVERVETQMVSKDDALAQGGEGGEDDWDAAWDEPEEERTTAVSSSQPSAPVAAAQSTSTADDDDGSAWDTDDLEGEAETGEGGAEEAWGWGDEEGSQKTSSPVLSKKELPKPNGERRPSTKPAEREMTLRETYTATSVPDGVLDIIKQVISDAQSLAGPEYASSPVAPAATGLYTLPTLALAMFRATAPTAYSKLDAGTQGNIGKMLIYNDASRLSEQLRAWQATQPPSSRLRLDNDAKALDQFAKREYSAEMEVQRTILRDHLDGAQGFANCTVQPNKAECESAIQETVDRIREVHRQWSPILAQSALLQSLGSLLATVTGKIILEVEELGDIAEADSQQLKILCERVSAVKDLFVTQRQDTEGVSDMTFIYCPNWLKFQYLAEILESSLADIKYLWHEGELSLEFEAEEVVELVEALFAESDLRRRAVAEIRRGGRR